MSENDQLKRWLQEAADDPELQRLLAEVRASDPLPDELLARYKAGLLNEEQARAVGRRAALDERAHLALALIDSDMQAAASEVQPSRVASLISSIASNLRRPAFVLQYSGVAAAVAAVVMVGVVLLDRPPGDVSTFYRSPIGSTHAKGGDSALLPGGRVVDRVDRSWPLHAPIGNVQSMRWFSWSPVVGAKGYRVELLDESGVTVHSSDVLSDSYFKLPRSVRRSLVPSRHYRWIVEALDPTGFVIVRGLGDTTILP